MADAPRGPAAEEPARAAEEPSRSPSGSRLWFWLRLAVALVLVVVLLRAIDFRAALATLARVDLRIVALVFAIALADRFLMAFKWNLLLRARGHGFSHLEAFRIYLATGFVGVWLPTGIGGDVYRAVRSSVSGRGVSTVSVTIILERALGLLAVAALSAVALAFMVAGGESRVRDLLVIALLLLVATLGALALSIQPRVYAWVKRVTARYADRKPVRMYLALHDAYVELSRERGLLVLFFLLSVFEQFVQVVMNWLGARALGLPVTLLQFTGLMPISNVIVMLPVSIAGIGVLEGTFVLMLGRIGVAAAEALSLSLLMRAVGWLMMAPAGAAFLWDAATLKRQRAAGQV
jgi:uncharacterized protein (TIRG00374 family)